MPQIRLGNEKSLGNKIVRRSTQRKLYLIASFFVHMIPLYVNRKRYPQKSPFWVGGLSQTEPKPFLKLSLARKRYKVNKWWASLSNVLLLLTFCIVKSGDFSTVWCFRIPIYPFKLHEVLQSIWGLSSNTGKAAALQILWRHRCFWSICQTWVTGQLCLQLANQVTTSAKQEEQARNDDTDTADGHGPRSQKPSRDTGEKRCSESTKS